MIRIESVTVHDLLTTACRDALAPIGEAVAAERGVNWNPANFFPHWANALKSGGSAFFAAWDGDKAVGVMIFSAFKDDVTGEPRVYENHWYVIPSHRGTSAGIKLFKAFLGACEAMDLKDITCFAPRSNVAEFYKRLGFKIEDAAYRRKS